jgi:site-specific DNA-methyltransferase (adenine-specific)
MGAERKIIGPNPNARQTLGTVQICKKNGSGVLTSPATKSARQWNGWGTVLKPAWEPIVLARKPLDGTVAANVLKHGTGALNIGGCRIGIEKRTYKGGGAQPHKLNAHEKGDTGIGLMDGRGKDLVFEVNGRFPANLIHDGSEEVVINFPETSITGKRKNPMKGYHQPDGGEWYGRTNHNGAEYTDSGSAARFFYCAKASPSERGKGNNHPTVKPLALMRYLCRLITPPGGIVLDPFCGSGSTCVAAIQEGFQFIGIDQGEETCEIARKRIALAREQQDLFRKPGVPQGQVGYR